LITLHGNPESNEEGVFLLIEDCGGPPAQYSIVNAKQREVLLAGFEEKRQTSSAEY